MSLLKKFIDFVTGSTANNSPAPTDLIPVLKDLGSGKFKTTKVEFSKFGGSSYLKYVALLNQSGINNPTATILENTIGNIVWTRNGTGIYLATLSNAFPQGKTLLIIGGTVGIFIGGAINYYGDIFWNDINSIGILTEQSNGIGGVQKIDDLLAFTSVEIRVYP